jgi:hypothetical protein
MSSHPEAKSRRSCRDAAQNTSSFVFSLGLGLLLRYCEVRAAEFAPIVDDVLALEFD